MKNQTHLFRAGLFFAFFLLIGFLVWNKPASVQAAVYKPAAPEVVGAAEARTAVLTWPKVKYADGYSIMRYNASTRKYVWIKTLVSSAEKLSFRIVEKENETYYYRVYSYRTVNGRRIMGNFKTVSVNTVPAPATYIVSASRQSNGSCTIKWQTNTKANGYKIYRKQKGGEWKQVKLITSRFVSSFTDTTTKKNTVYYYRVRAFRKNSNSVVLGSYGNTVTIGGSTVLVPTPTPSPTPTPAPTNGPSIIIGDSRTKMMNYFVEGISKNDTWYFQTSAGYTWLKNTVAPQVLNTVKKNDRVFVWLGTNDVYQLNNYINFYNSFGAQLKAKGAKLYVMGVGQVEYDPYVTNAEIKEFNNKLRAGLKNITYLDLYSYLETSGYKTTDGSHYDGPTSKRIYQWMKQQGV